MVKHLKWNFCIFMAALLLFVGSMSVGDLLDTEAVNKMMTIEIDSYGTMDYRPPLSDDTQAVLPVSFIGGNRIVTKLSFGIRFLDDLHMYNTDTDNNLIYAVSTSGDIQPEYEWIDENTLWVDWEGEPTKVGTILSLVIRNIDTIDWASSYGSIDLSFVQELDGRTASVVCEDGIDYAAEGFVQWENGWIVYGYGDLSEATVDVPEEPYYVHVGDVFALTDVELAENYYYSIDISDDSIVTLISASRMKALSPGTVTVSAVANRYQGERERTVIVLAEGEEPTTQPPTTQPPTTQPPTTQPPTTQPPTTDPTEPSTDGLMLEETWVTLANGRQYTIRANQTGLTYKSSNPDVAIVSPSGVVTAIAEGTAIINVFNANYETVQLHVTVTSYQDTFQSGDVNGDGEIDIRDVILTNKFLLGSVSLTQVQAEAADVDGSSKVDTTDALNILKYVVKLIASFELL